MKKHNPHLAMLCHMIITTWDDEVIVHNRLLPTMKPHWFRRRIRLVRPSGVSPRPPMELR